VFWNDTTYSEHRNDDDDDDDDDDAYCEHNEEVVSYKDGVICFVYKRVVLWGILIDRMHNVKQTFIWHQSFSVTICVQPQNCDCSVSKMPLATCSFQILHVVDNFLLYRGFSRDIS
jgi:hypothetical protein